MLRIAILFLSIIFSIPVLAQPIAPDYSIRLIRSRFTEDNAQTIVEFDVVNIGAAATVSATATLNHIATGQQVASAVVPPLGSQQSRTVSLSFSTALFGPNSVESFRASVGVDEVEETGSQGLQDNYALISITFPASIPTPAFTPSPEDAADTSTQPDQSPSDQPQDALTPIFDALRIDRTDSAQVAFLVGIVGAALILLLLLFVIVRLLFQRPPEFTNWQPPYANVLYSDPNSTAGRRHQWQMHAQNSSLPPNMSEATVLVRKLPLGADGDYLGDWRVTGMRLCQYDMYGRVSRSQIIVPRRQLNRLNWIIRKQGKWSPEKVTKQLAPLCRALSGTVRKKLTERTAGLPLAVDVRLTGRHGDVGIWFELYRVQYGQWTTIDRWQPEMVITGKTIQENFTYTLHGQRPNENTKQFAQRLQADMSRTFFDLLRPPLPDLPSASSPSTPPAAVPRVDAPTDPHMQPVPPTLPD